MTLLKQLDQYMTNNMKDMCIIRINQIVELEKMYLVKKRG